MPPAICSEAKREPSQFTIVFDDEGGTCNWLGVLPMEVVDASDG